MGRDEFVDTVHVLSLEGLQNCSECEYNGSTVFETVLPNEGDGPI